MLLVIHNLPKDIRYTDIKALIKSKCGINEVILDNFVPEGENKRVTVGLADEGDAAFLVRQINGLYIGGCQLYVEDVRQKKMPEQPYRPIENPHVPHRKPTTVPTVPPMAAMQHMRPPTMQHTMQQTMQPTIQPMTQPTMQQTMQPTIQPMTQPTMQQTMQPTIQPMTQPTMQQTMQPTIQPMTQPTMQQTMQPTIQPMTQPTMQQTMQPTIQPMTQPTMQQTMQPTIQPMTQPTMQHRMQTPTVAYSNLPFYMSPETGYPNYENQAAQTPTPKPLPQPAYQAAYQQPQPSVSQWKSPQQPANNAVSAANNSGALWERQSGSPRRDDEPWRGHGEQTERGEPDHEGSDNGSSRSRTSKCNESDGRRERSPARGRDYRDSRRDDNRDSRRDDNRGFRRDEDTGHRTRMGTPTKRPYSEILQGSRSFGNDPDNSSFSMSNAGIFNKQPVGPGPVADASKRSRFDQIDKRSISQRQRHTCSSATAADKENIPVEINIQGTQNMEVMPPQSSQEYLNVMLQQAGMADVVQEPVTPRPPDVEPRTSDAQRARDGRSSDTPLGSLDRTKVSLGDSDKTTDSQRFIDQAIEPQVELPRAAPSEGRVQRSEAEIVLDPLEEEKKKKILENVLLEAKLRFGYINCWASGSAVWVALGGFRYKVTCMADLEYIPPLCEHKSPDLEDLAGEPRRKRRRLELIIDKSTQLDADYCRVRVANDDVELRCATAKEDVIQPRTPAVTLLSRPARSGAKPVSSFKTGYPNYENQAAQTPTPKPLPQPAYQAAYQQPQPSVSQWKSPKLPAYSSYPQQPANNAVSAANNSGALWERQSGSPRRDDEPWRGHGEQTERGEPDHEGSDNGSSRSRTSKCNESDGRRERSPARGRDYRDSRRDDNRDSRRDDNRGFRRDEDTGHRTRMGTPTKRPYSEISQGSRSFGNDPDNSSFSMSNAGIFNKQPVGPGPVADASKRSRFDQIDKRSISQRQRHTCSSATAADKENIPVEINIQGTQNMEVMPPQSSQEYLNVMLQQAGMADVVQEPVTPRPPDVEPRTSDAQCARDGRSSETPLGSLDRTKVSLGDSDKTTDLQRFIDEEWGTRGTMFKIFRCALAGVPDITVELLVRRGPVLEGSRRRIAARCFTSILKLSSQGFIKVIKDADTNEIKHIELGPRIPLPGRR